MENLSKTEIVMVLFVLYLFYRLVKELAWVWVYTLVLKLKAEGKLIQENDPKNIEGRTYNKAIKKTKSII